MDFRGAPQEFPYIPQTKPRSSGQEETRPDMAARRHNVTDPKVPIIYPEILKGVVPGLVYWPDMGSDTGGPGRGERHRSRANVMSANKEGRAVRLRVRVAGPHVDPVMINKYGGGQTGLIHPNHGPDVGVRQESGARDAVCSRRTGQKVDRGRKAIGNQHAHVGPCTFTGVIVRNVVVCAEGGIRPYIVRV